MEFDSGTEGLAGLQKVLQNDSKTKIKVFLDLNMPIMNGWDTLDELRKVDFLTKNVNIYMLSSTVNVKEINQAKEHELIKDFV